MRVEREQSVFGAHQFVCKWGELNKAARLLSNEDEMGEQEGVMRIKNENHGMEEPPKQFRPSSYLPGGWINQRDELWVFMLTDGNKCLFK